jgi:Small subunit of acetolactate synthase
VGLNVDTALFTITVAATAEEAQQLLQRVFQLEQVWWVGQPAPLCSYPTQRQPCEVWRVALHARIHARVEDIAALACHGTKVPCRDLLTWTRPTPRVHINRAFRRARRQPHQRAPRRPHPQVLYVEDLTAQNRVERELVLIKVRAPNGPARTEVTELAKIFRAHILDTSGAWRSVCCSASIARECHKPGFHMLLPQRKRLHRGRLRWQCAE